MSERLRRFIPNNNEGRGGRMLVKILIVCAAVFVFCWDRKRRPALTYLRLWGRSRYRRNKTAEAELLQIIKSETGEGYHLTFDVPSLQKRAVLAVHDREANFLCGALETLYKAAGTDERISLTLKQYKIADEIFLLADQEEPADAEYLASFQKENEAQKKCQSVREAGTVMLMAGAVAGIASAFLGMILILTGSIVLWMNLPFAGTEMWKTKCRLEARPLQLADADATTTYPDDFLQWSCAAKYLHGFCKKYDDTEEPMLQGRAEDDSEDVCNTSFSEEPISKDSQSADQSKGELSDLSISSIPSFSRGFQEKRYVKKGNAFK